MQLFIGFAILFGIWIALKRLSKGDDEKAQEQQIIEILDRIIVILEWRYDCPPVAQEGKGESNGEKI